MKDLFSSFQKHFTPRPGAPVLPPNTDTVHNWAALGMDIPLVQLWGAAGAGVTAIAAVAEGAYAHFEESLFGTINALQAVTNGPAHAAAGLHVAAPAALVAGFLPNGAWINGLVVYRDATAVPVLTAHSGVPGAVIPQGRAGAGATNRANAAALIRAEKVLFVGIFPHNANIESTIHIGCRVSTLLANSLIKSNGRTVARSGTCSAPPQAWTLGAIATGVVEEAGIEGYFPFRSEVVYATPANQVPAIPTPLPNPATPLSRAQALRTFWNVDDPVFGAWSSPAPYVNDLGRVMKWLTDTIQAPAGIGSAFSRNYISFNHSLEAPPGSQNMMRQKRLLCWDGHKKRHTAGKKRTLFAT